jgi:hypothetical protein
VADKNSYVVLSACIFSTTVSCKLRVCMAMHLVRCACAPLAILCAHDEMHRLFSALDHSENGRHVVSGTLAEFYFIAYCGGVWAQQFANLLKLYLFIPAILCGNSSFPTIFCIPVCYHYISQNVDFILSPSTLLWHSLSHMIHCFICFVSFPHLLELVVINLKLWFWVAFNTFVFNWFHPKYTAT